MMKTLRSIIPVLMMALLTAGSSVVHGQDKAVQEEIMKNRKEMAEKLKAQKIAFITEHLQLTPGEAEKFWPIYNEMEQQREESVISIMERFRHDEEEKEMTDEKAMEIMDVRFKREKDLLDLKLNYHKKFLDILPATKVLRLYDVEDKFRRHLMDRIGHGREGERKPEGRGSAPPERGERTFRRQ